MKVSRGEKLLVAVVMAVGTLVASPTAVQAQQLTVDDEARDTLDPGLDVTRRPSATASERSSLTSPSSVTGVGRSSSLSRLAALAAG
jgi:hypothetical protein